MFLSRDVMAPARARSDLSAAARDAIAALLKVDNVNSPVGKKSSGAHPVDRSSTMSGLIEGMRDAGWSAVVPGLHGTLLIADGSPEAKTELNCKWARWTRVYCFYCVGRE